MKKYIIMAAAAAAALCACSKVQSERSDREISFEVANYLPTKASGAKYDQALSFGTYAWFNGSEEFMTNERVSFVAPAWKSVDHTFYWPKTGSLSFISYSPFAGTSNVAGTVPAVTPTSIAWNAYTVGDDDVLYADKVTCTENVDAITDDLGGTPDSGFEGVPTLFRHALAKVAFKVRASFLQKGSGTDLTTWEITLKSFTVSGLYTKGDCALAWSGSEWTKPVDASGYKVWTPDALSVSADKELVASPVSLSDAADGELLASVAPFVLPQTLDGTQVINFALHIKTTLPNGKVIEEDYTPAAPLSLSALSSIGAWQINENVTYTVSFKPTADSGEEILFDPAVADWTEVPASIEIQL